ncbi:MAG: benzoate/H(+) symporter BenE family transporter, partial [Proteobacteria bacterium]|nr:benzoate/H(+) symporter BenE family transporter [Pseudomonadota bacterium]
MTERDNGSIIERGPGFREGLRDLPAAINLNSVSAGTVAAIFGCSGPALIVIGAAAAGKLTSGQTVAWLLAIYGLGGLISLLLALRYKMPINGAYSIPGAAIMTAAFASFSFPEIVGAFIMSGAIVLLLGVTGVIGRIMHWLPMPIVMAMIVGAMIRFGVGAVDSVKAAPIIAGSAALAFFLTMRFIKTFPPVLAALIVGLFAAAATGSIQAATVDIAFVAPEFTVPVFTMAAFFGVAVPLAALVIGAENAQATGVLMAEGYKPPVNAMTIVSGIGGILAGCMGGHNANIAGPMTAICSSEQAGEDRSKRYGATVVNGLLFGAFGLLAGVAVPFVLAL